MNELPEELERQLQELARDAAGQCLARSLIEDREAVADVFRPIFAWLAAVECALGKLPKTADGVPIVPGMTLYYPLDGKQRGEVQAKTVDEHLSLTTEGYTPVIHSYCWYSTREAALASAGRKETGT